MHRFVVSLPLREGSAEKVRAILAEGPPFDIGDTSLERHEVFLAGDELLFLFEGAAAEAEARRLLAHPRVLDQAGRIGAYAAGSPRFPQEVFAWERPATTEGVTFGPLPGPGDSDG